MLSDCAYMTAITTSTVGFFELGQMREVPGARELIRTFENGRTNFPAWSPRHCCESGRDGAVGASCLLVGICGALFLGWDALGRTARAAQAKAADTSG